MRGPAKAALFLVVDLRTLEAPAEVDVRHFRSTSGASRPIRRETNAGSDVPLPRRRCPPSVAPNGEEQQNLSMTTQTIQDAATAIDALVALVAAIAE
jgi:hypothetical protein